VIGMMAGESVLEALRCEAEALSAAARDLGEDDWSRPTRCEPWSVRELLGHVCVVIGWLPQMLESAAPAEPQVTATGYYRPDARFSPATNAARIESARARAARHADNGAGLAADFDATWRQAYGLCGAQPSGRIVATRHGDAMLLSEFLLTRVVEVAVHGMDIADALGREPWLTEQAEGAVLNLVIGPAYREHIRVLNWDGVTALRKVTGRAALTGIEAETIGRLGPTWITLG
jgi:uncharacterized protein (TIGR03083 family)